jgi:enoyl-CoA hydratase/carnithine racemase
MTPALLADFADAIGRARAADIRCLVITGRGSCFSAGADLEADLQWASDEPPHDRSFRMYEPFLTVLDVEVPVVAALNGHAVGGGFGLALLCDIRVASRAAKLGANFARLGITSGLGISYLLPRLVGVARASEMLFTGRYVDGVQAERIGLVNEAVEPEEVLPRASTLARDVAAAAPLAVREIKRAIRRGLGWDVPGAARVEAFAQALSLETEDAKEGVTALLQKREPRFTGT